MGTPGGGLVWNEENGLLGPVSTFLENRRVRTLWFNTQTSGLYAATDKGRLFFSSDLGTNWKLWGKSDTRVYPYEILGLENTPDLFFTRDFSAGLLRSTDGGMTWNATGLEISPRNISALGISEKTPSTILIGTLQEGLFKSVTGGDSWREIQSVSLKSRRELTKEISSGKPFDPKIPPPPTAFTKCNFCHGWVDPNLRIYRNNFWQIYPTKRDWTLTVSRMGQRADLFDEERAQIINYMNQYYGPE